MRVNKLAGLMIAIGATALLLGCTKYDPYTGQQQVDYGATAGVAGLALGAAALGVAASNRNEPDVVVVNPGPVYRPYYRPPVYGGGYRPGYRPPPPPVHRPGYHPGPRPGYPAGNRPGYRPAGRPGYQPGNRPNHYPAGRPGHRH